MASKGDSTDLGHDPSTHSLTKLKLPQPVTYTKLQTTKRELNEILQRDQQASSLQHKLQTITDQPTWNAFIPFGPLAYFPGQLIHTNDITQTIPLETADSGVASGETQPQPLSDNKSDAVSSTPAQTGHRTVLKSAKQARESVAKTREELAQRITELKKLIDEQESASKREQKEQNQEDWTFNDDGEVINEEGLPMFDIREELPPEPELPHVKDSASGSSKAQDESDGPKMRYLIKKGGKQIVRPLKASSTSSDSARADSTSQDVSSPASTHKSAASLDTKAIFDQLEREEALEKASSKSSEAGSGDVVDMPTTGSSPRDKLHAESNPITAAESPRKTKKPSAASAVSFKDAAEAPGSSSKSSASSLGAIVTPSAPPRTPASSSKDFLSGFSAGFLTKGKSQSAAGPSSQQLQSKKEGSLVTSPTTQPASIASPASSSFIPDAEEDKVKRATAGSTTTIPTSPPLHTPNHHILPAPKSIYRPTPPGTPLRSSSPAPVSQSHQGGSKASTNSEDADGTTRPHVSFDLPSPSSEDAPENKVSTKSKRAPIILGPPPITDSSASSTLSSSTTSVKGKERALDSETLEDDRHSLDQKPASQPVERPIKDKVVERAVKAPVAPGAGVGHSKKLDRAERDRERWKMFGGLERPRNGLGGGVGAVKSTVPASSTSTSTSTGKDNVPIASKIEEIEEDDEETQVGDGGKGSTTGMPIHTISLSAKKASSSSSASSLGSREPGHASLNDLLSSDDDGHDDEDEDGSDEFYANESGDEYDDDEDEEIDIDAALEAREAALAYHEKRMAIGAGAGTGPLGGDAAPDAFDAWNQADVPIDATMQGRPPAHGGASRFRTGRLESTSMILPSLLAENVRVSKTQDPNDDDRVAAAADGDEEDVDEDEYTPEERARLKRGLEALATDGKLPDDFTITVEKIQAAQAQAQTDANGQPTLSRVREKAPPVVQRATPIVTPPVAPSLSQESAAAVPPSKKMSRFRARQLGLETEA